MAITTLLVFSLALGLEWQGNFQQIATVPTPARSVAPKVTLARLPLSFEKNVGQTDAQVQFLARSSSGSFFLTQTEAVWRLHAPEIPPDDRGPASSSAAKPAQADAVLRLTLSGANPAPKVVGAEPFPGKVNYLSGANRAARRTNVPTFGQVRCEQVYPGVDLVYYGTQGQLECDFVLAPGVDPAVVRLHFAGADRLEIDANRGDLVARTAAGEVRWHRPVVYQEIAGHRRAVEGKYFCRNAQEIGFQIAAYDAGQPLIIDPVLVYSTYLGPGTGPQGSGLAVDASGNVYLAGETDSPDFPTTTGAVQRAFRGGNNERYGGNDVYVAKLNPAGNALVYSTYLGGTGSDWALALALDSAGRAFVTGQTKSNDFPTTPGAFQSTNGGGWDTFILELNEAGSALVYSTLIGGTQDDLGFGIAVDASDNAVVTGWTLSSNFPTTTNAQQPASRGGYEAFVTKLDARGNLLYSTFLGGSGDDKGYSIALDSAANAYLTGYTTSDDFPVTVGAIRTARANSGTASDAFITKLNASGLIQYSTFLGGSGSDAGNGIKVDSAGNVYVAGLTNSPNLPITVGAYGFKGSLDAWVAKLNAAGSALIYCTYAGGSGADTATALAIDSAGSAYVTGFTASANFPVVGMAPQAKWGGDYDAFLLKLTPDGSLLNGGYSTYLGGSAFDQGECIALDPAGNVYVGGVTASANFPTTTGALQTNFTGTTQDPFIAKIASTLTGTSSPAPTATASPTVSPSATIAPTPTPAPPTPVPNVSPDPTVTPSPSPTTPSPSSTVLAVVNPCADAFVRDGSFVRTNYGTVNPLVIQASATVGYSRQAFVKFPLTGIPGSFNRVTLRLYGSRNTTSAVPEEVYGVTNDSWSETGLNWNNRPVRGGIVASVAISKASGWWEWDVTSFITARRFAGSSFASLALVMTQLPSPEGNDSFNSREAASNQPQLVFSFQP